MKAISIVTACMLLSLACFSQKTPQTPEELQAFIKSMQKKADSMQAAANIKTTSGNIGITTKQEIPQTGKNTQTEKLPELDSARVRKLPKTILSTTELNNYINNLYDQ